MFLPGRRLLGIKRPLGQPLRPTPPVQPVVSSGAKCPASSSGLVAWAGFAGLGDKATGQVGKRVRSRSRKSWAGREFDQPLEGPKLP